MVSLIWLLAPFLVIDFGMMFTYPFALPQYPFFFRNMLHDSAAQYGLVFSTYGMALAIFPLVLGRLSETLPKKSLIVIGTLLFGALNASIFATPLYPLLLLGAVLNGYAFPTFCSAMTCLAQATSACCLCERIP